MRTLKASLLALGLTAGLASTASAQLSFDDITAGPMAMVTNYGGYNWTNAFVIDPSGYFGSVAAAGGFHTAMQSPSWVLSNAGAKALSITKASGFNLTGGTFAAAWKNGLTLNAAGYLNGVQMYNQNYSLDWSVASYLALNMYGVDEVIFTSAGGTDAPGYGGRNSGFAMDDLSFSTGEREIPIEASVAVVPEPMSLSLVGFGLLALGGVQARRRRKAAAI